MALAIASGFLLQSTAPNFERDMFTTIAEMKTYPDASLPDVFVSTCVEDGCVYCYNRTNEELESTGKWRKVGSGDSNIWIGTTAEYDAAAAMGTIATGTLVFITDDTPDGASSGIVYDTELSETSENAVTNKAITKALNKKVDAIDGKGLSTYDFDDTAYNKLSGIAAGANKTVCDTTIQTSNNPVTNTAIKNALDAKPISKVIDVNVTYGSPVTVDTLSSGKLYIFESDHAIYMFHFKTGGYYNIFSSGDTAHLMLEGSGIHSVIISVSDSLHQASGKIIQIG